jgi:hypothetical protein
LESHISNTYYYILYLEILNKKFFYNIIIWFFDFEKITYRRRDELTIINVVCYRQKIFKDITGKIIFHMYRISIWLFIFYSIVVRQHPEFQYLTLAYLHSLTPVIR